MDEKQLRGMEESWKICILLGKQSFCKLIQVNVYAFTYYGSFITVFREQAQLSGGDLHLETKLIHMFNAEAYFTQMRFSTFHMICLNR